MARTLDYFSPYVAPAKSFCVLHNAAEPKSQKLQKHQSLNPTAVSEFGVKVGGALRS